MVQELSRCRLMYHAFRKSLVFSDFRTVCGRFVSVFMVFMSKRAMAAKRNRYNVLKLKSILRGATCGLLLSILFWGSNLLLQCGEVEPNPGPPKATVRIFVSCYCSLFVCFFFFLCFLLFFVFIVISHSVSVSEMKLFVHLTLCVFSSCMSSSPISYSLLMST